MPTLDKHQSSTLTKMLLLGDSGTGKTGSLLSLVEAGYKLRILDLDNGLDVLVNLIREKNKPELLQNVSFFTVSNKFTNSAGKIAVASASAWTRTMKYMTRWTNEGEPARDPRGVPLYEEVPNLKDPTKPTRKPILITKDHPDFEDLGKPENWGPDCVLVVDSFTFLCNAAMKYVMFSNGRPGGPVYESDWGIAQNAVEDFLGMLYGEDFNTNLILIAHVLYRDLGQGTKAYPNALGKALPPKVGRYVNSMLEVSRTGTGANATRKIHTVPHGLLDLKNPNPLRVKSEYPISTGLADFFKAVRG